MIDQDLFNELILKSSLLFILSVIFLKIISLQRNVYFLDNSKKPHANNKSIPRVASIVFFLIFIIEYFFQFLNQTYYFNLIFISSYLFLIVGLFEDVFKNIRPLYRFIIIFIFTIFFVIFFKLKIHFTNSFFNHDIFLIIFTILCLAIIINGFNFIDGLNGLLIIYSIIISLILIYFSLIQNDYNQFIELSLFTVVLVSLLIFNFPYARIYLGDGGAYFSAFFLGYQSIITYNNNNLISPFFIAVLFFYPATEVFFSILRRILLNRSISQPDKLHIHHYLQEYIYNKYNFKNYETSNFLSSIIILSVISSSFFIGLINYSSNIVNIFILLTLLIVYLIINVFFKKTFK